MKHKGKVLSEQEVLDNRSSKYEFINFETMEKEESLIDDYYTGSDILDECAPKQETLEEAAENYTNSMKYEYDSSTRSFIDGAKWQQERSYSEKDMNDYALYILRNSIITPKEWWEKFKKK